MKKNLDLIIEIIYFAPNENKLEIKKNSDEQFISFLFQINEKSDESIKDLFKKLKEIFVESKGFAKMFVSSFTLDVGFIEYLINIFLTSNNLRESSKDLLKFFIENLTIEKKHYDYIYGKLGKEHRQGTLTFQKLLINIKLILLFYGKDIENKKYFPKKYLFFLNPSKSIISTNICEDNKLILKNNFSIYFSFY